MVRVQPTKRPTTCTYAASHSHTMAIRIAKPFRMLERSVGLDATFAPAWSALGKRYYYEEEYGVGATGVMTRTAPALRRALALDPNLEDAAQQIAILDTDAGKLAQAYQEAKQMVEKRPQSGFAHFTLSYVLRYASLSK